MRLSRVLLPAVLFTLPFLALFAVEGSVVRPSTTSVDHSRSYRLFPDLYLQDSLLKREQAERAKPYWVDTQFEAVAQQRMATDFQSILLNKDILAFYGTPLSKRMGILGVHTKEEIDKMMDEWVARYDQANGERGIQKAFYIIFGMAWPQGEIGTLKDSKLIEYIEYAQAHNILVFVDHQIGKYSVAESMNRILPYLRYPNVHLALDPEWRTLKPMEEIGSVSAAEINQAQKMMEDYIVEHGIPGERMLVIHQFNCGMITNREQVRSDFSRVRLVHCADGFGGPALKRASYRYNALATNMPVKGFKLFFKSGVPGAGFDNPLLTPEEVFALTPRPYVIMYQ